MGRIREGDLRVARARETARQALGSVRRRTDHLSTLLGRHPVALVGGGVLLGAIAGRFLRGAPRASTRGAGLRLLFRLSSWASTGLSMVARAQSMLAGLQANLADKAADAAANDVDAST